MSPGAVTTACGTRGSRGGDREDARRRRRAAEFVEPWNLGEVLTAGTGSHDVLPGSGRRAGELFG